jgi:hypothetical protein
MPINSKQQHLNSAGVISDWLKHNPQPHPPQVMMAGILQELSDPSVKTKQFGNTLFEVMPGKDGQAFFKAFNADSGPNFVDNSKLFCVWARRVLGLKTLVTEFSDPSLERLFKIISMNPPIPKMGYQVFHMSNGSTRIALNLGV